MKENITGKRLRELREKKKVSQSEVANFLGIERTTYTAYESGKSRPVRYMDKLAEYFNVSVDYLLGVSDIPQQKKQNLDDTEKGLLYSYWKLNEKGKEAFSAYVNFLLSQPQYTEKEKNISVS